MVGDNTKKLIVAENLEDSIDGELVLSIEKLQEVQDELDKVSFTISNSTSPFYAS